MSSSIYLQYWHPATREMLSRELDTVDEVMTVARLVEDEYRRATVDFLPGLALWRDAETPQNSLSLGIAQDGWAVIHTDEDFFQKVTRGPRPPDGIRRRVLFEDFLEVSSSCFIAGATAIEAVSHWRLIHKYLGGSGGNQS